MWRAIFANITVPTMCWYLIMIWPFAGIFLALIILPIPIALATQSSSSSSNGLQCQRISVTACQGLGYNMTAIPNLANHNSQLEAELRITQLLPLIESNCSNRIRFLICSSLLPLCTPDVPRPVTACNSLCETVKEECSSQKDLMQLWPEFLHCEQLPQPEKHELCMQVPATDFNRRDQNTHLMANLLSSSIGVTAPTQKSSATDRRQSLQIPPQLLSGRSLSANSHYGWPGWLTSNHNILHDNQLPKQQQNSNTLASSLGALCPQNFSLNHLDANECLPQCDRDAFHSTEQKKVAESLILGLSAICFVFTLFSLVTFWAEPTRFGYPERPILFLCLCYNLFSICYLERIIFHNSARAFALLEETITITIHNTPIACNVTPPCLASYITTSYLSLCAATWWLVFALCFYLSSHKKWSSEALEKKAGLFHVLAWVPPLAPPIAALLLERVKLSELTGMCSAPGFVEVPAIILLVFGLIFTLRTSKSLHLLQQQILPSLGHQRFAQIRKRFLIFSLVFFIPTLAGVLCTFFERVPETVSVCTIGEDCTPPPVAIAWPTLVRLFFQLSGGTLTGLWVWSRKTCESYRSRFIATPTSSMTNSIVKTANTAMPKKHLHSALGKSSTLGAPLYSGINFHTVPTYCSSHLQRV